ncbi:hypothetical protein BU24DRAFT_427609 [Aaosphaeria arxii CBS 175.79]|uniref:Uncharacterized protein n=1 Tax=Aaosphaeria arxii CBS 175.79 TaxID=1450172 RepID=A0A6A5XCF1_9PLEO|nr:uncharacterized protein BU24DRAFT_427609 [Aaosphaeria arxii CBS 175.79]KAF2010487.1 hypothetical protein BU24DRAFT_427609 [Aaosphaeria arxii CBS 175.79]
MQIQGSTSSITLAIIGFLSLSTVTLAAPATAEHASREVSARQTPNVPSAINIGLRENSNPDHAMWVAWVNGEDPCDSGRYQELGVYNDQGQPCNIRFSFPNKDFQYSMQGCGEPDNNIWLMQNGKDNVGSCRYAPGNNPCAAGTTFKGQWQCIYNQ